MLDRFDKDYDRIDHHLMRCVKAQFEDVTAEENNIIISKGVKCIHCGLILPRRHTTENIKHLAYCDKYGQSNEENKENQIKFMFHIVSCKSLWRTPRDEMKRQKLLMRAHTLAGVPAPLSYNIPNMNAVTMSQSYPTDSLNSNYDSNQPIFVSYSDNDNFSPPPSYASQASHQQPAHSYPVHNRQSNITVAVPPYSHPSYFQAPNNSNNPVIANNNTNNSNANSNKAYSNVNVVTLPDNTSKLNSSTNVNNNANNNVNNMEIANQMISLNKNLNVVSLNSTNSNNTTLTTNESISTSNNTTFENTVELYPAKSILSMPPPNEETSEIDYSKINDSLFTWIEFQNIDWQAVNDADFREFLLAVNPELDLKKVKFKISDFSSFHQNISKKRKSSAMSNTY